MRNVNRQRIQRSGLSLLEVIIATLVLAVSAAMLVQLLGNGDRQASRAEKRVQAQLICQNRLDEILAAIEPMESVEVHPSLFYPDWHISVHVQDIEGSAEVSRAEFVLVEVRVYYRKSDDESIGLSAPNLADEQPVYALRRVMRKVTSSQDPADANFLLNGSMERQ